MSNKAEITLRRMRQRIFDYPEHKEDQAMRVLEYLKRRFLRSPEHQAHLADMDYRRSERMLRMWD